MAGLDTSVAGSITRPVGGASSKVIDRSLVMLCEPDISSSRPQTSDMAGRVVRSFLSMSSTRYCIGSLTLGLMSRAWAGLVDVFGQHRAFAVAILARHERQAAGQHLKKMTPRLYIRAIVDLRHAATLLRRHVVRRAHQRAGARLRIVEI